MNKKILADIIREHALVEKPANVLSGNMKGYYTVISLGERNVANISVNAVVGTTPIVEMEEFLRRLESENKKVISCAYEQSCIEVSVQIPAFGKKVSTLVNNVTDRIIEYLEQNGYESGCAFCGNKEVPLSLNNFLGNIVICCDECAKEYSDAIKEKQVEFKERKGNYLAGLVGGLLGSLIGFAVYFGIYQLGYIAVISGIVMSICVLKGFELLGGKLNILGAISCTVISVAMAYVANRFACSYEITEIINSYYECDYSVFTYFKSLEEALEMFEGGYDLYLENMVYGCGATLVAGIVYSVKAFKERALIGEVKRY